MDLDANPDDTCPETSANRFSDASTDATKESIFSSKMKLFFYLKYIVK